MEHVEPEVQSVDENPETVLPESIDKQKLLESINSVIDYLSNSIAQKVSENVSSGEKPQNGFNAVNKAAETMAMSGGKKFKKTRHFRITNKNKSKKIA